MPRSNVVILRPTDGARAAYSLQMERKPGGRLEYEISGLADSENDRTVMAGMLEAIAADLRAGSRAMQTS